ncbi:hypothetical protein DAPPUDRAFT_107269 [Daphnia pulex]|uniref:Uncharacterized protein n=1 Tax=Daphnia pulex TaxID=6669 RepID=E9GWK3_DAPPU|nr:hypothetical protein DAPPUDRAFT_107269 [Daphnia pulex]|eukprot:EFX76117.1 hypothetical protein DAPPUDRAFT_107269 [Daphnia pulex]
MGDEPGPSKPNTRGKKNKKNVETMVEPEQPGTEDTAQSTPGDPPLPEEKNTQESEHDSDAEESEYEEDEQQETVTVQTLVKKYTGKIRQKVRDNRKAIMDNDANILKTDANVSTLFSDFNLLESRMVLIETKYEKQRQQIQELKARVQTCTRETSMDASEAHNLHLARQAEITELIKEIDQEYTNYQNGNSDEKLIAFTRAKTIENILNKCTDEIWPHNTIAQRKDLRNQRAAADELLARMKSGQAATAAKHSGTAKPKLGLPAFDGDPMKYFGWIKQWNTYDEDTSIADTEKARLLEQCLTGKALDSIHDIPFSKDIYQNRKTRLEERYGNKNEKSVGRRYPQTLTQMFYET